MDELKEMQALDPTLAQRRRMHQWVDSEFEAAHTSLMAEWIDLIAARPVRHTLVALAACALMLFVSPLGGLLALFGQVG